MQLSKNFDSKEFNCPHCNECKMDLEFVNLLQIMRTKWGKPIKITSGYRCPAHNTAIKGAQNSQHILGLAADLDTSSMDSEQKYAFIALAFQLGFKGIGIAKTFLHVDSRKEKNSTWLY